MSKPVNFLDLIKNPDKISHTNQKQATNTNGSIPKEAVIPPNLNGAQKNEWLEMQKKNQSNSASKNDDVQILDGNPFLNNQGNDGKKQQIQKQNLQQIYPRNLSNSNKDTNIQSAQKSVQQQVNIQQQQPITKQTVIKIDDDQINYRPQQNQANSKPSNQDRNLNANVELSKKYSIQFGSSGSNSVNNNNGNANKPAVQQNNTPTSNRTQNGANSQRVQQNRSIGSIFSSNASTKSTGMSKQEMLRAKYSLRNQSKEDYKKIFSRIVKEYSDEENQYYDSNKTKFSTYIIFILIAIVSVMVTFDVIAQRTPKFCNNSIKENTPKCIVCPEFAKCKNSVMKCKEGYIQQGYTCIMNPNLISSSKSFIIEKITEMQYDNGHRVCFQQESEGDQKSQDEISKVSRDQLVQELTSRIADLKTVRSQKEILDNFLVDVKNQKEFDFFYEGETLTLSTSRIRFTLFCQSKNFLKNNYRIIAISFILLCILILLGLYAKKLLKQKRIAREIYNELVDQIQASSEKQINISYYKEGIVNRYKGDFNEEIWIIVDGLRFQERKINVYRDYDGLYWSQI